MQTAGKFWCKKRKCSQGRIEVRMVDEKNRHSWAMRRLEALHTIAGHHNHLHGIEELVMYRRDYYYNDLFEIEEIRNRIPEPIEAAIRRKLHQTIKELGDIAPLEDDYNQLVDFVELMWGALVRLELCNQLAPFDLVSLPPSDISYLVASYLIDPHPSSEDPQIEWFSYPCKDEEDECLRHKLPTAWCEFGYFPLAPISLCEPPKAIGDLATTVDNGFAFEGCKLVVFENHEEEDEEEDDYKRQDPDFLASHEPKLWTLVIHCTPDELWGDGCELSRFHCVLLRPGDRVHDDR